MIYTARENYSMEFDASKIFIKQTKEIHITVKLTIDESFIFSL